MTRLIAFIILVLPGIIAAYGVKLMRDAVFVELSDPFSSVWMQFSFGLLIFLLGVFFIGGFIYRRDQKRKKVTKRLGKKGCTGHN